MAELSSLSKTELESLKSRLEARYAEFKGRGLQLDMTRGKPSSEQLDLANALLTLPGEGDFKTASGVDCRNYGGIDGIAEAKALFADYMEVSTDEIILGGAASLTLMHDTVVNALLHGVVGSERPWGKQTIKFLCPTPGYDRHFSICEHFGIEMIAIETNDDGPDMQRVEQLVAQDESIKGIWCVPKYGNPTGAVYSDEVVTRLAGMNTAARDFRIMWDNAYAVHTLTDSPAELKNLLQACKNAGNANRALMYGSTSKISFAGMGISMMAASTENLDWMRSHLKIQTIGPDKTNQLRHVRFFEDMKGVLAHMQKHAEILRPKFAAVHRILERELAGKAIATWTKPKGGYFVSLDTLDDCARDVVALAGEAGVKMTGAGATFPYKKDPRNRNIRIAPSLPPLEDIELAMEGIAICVQLVSVRRMLAS